MNNFSFHNLGQRIACQAGVRRRPRRGITLVLVLSIIVLFLLMGTSFVIVSTQYLSGSRARLVNLDVRGDQPKDLVRRAFYGLVRGPDLLNAASPLRGHSILADQYGYGFAFQLDGGTTTAATDVSLTSTGLPVGMIDIMVPTGYPAFPFESAGASVPLNVAPNELATGFFDGCVLSIVSGPAKGVSARVIRFNIDPATSDLHFLVLINKSEFGSITAAEIAEAKLIVNGRPFSGKGAGGLRPVQAYGTPALRQAAYRPNQSQNPLLTPAPIFFGPNGYISSGVNEPWDAIDYQNMFLGADDLVNNIVYPSFDSQRLFDHATEDRANFRAFGRPGDALHVDNDGDGELDSVWMDIGLPVQTDENGRFYKPLVAYRVVDLDGRLNLNAHGNMFDAADDRQATPDYLLGENTINPPAAYQTLGWGQGYGPGEISLSNILTPLEYQQVLAGNAVFPGRYTNSTTSVNMPGFDGHDIWSQAKLAGYPTGPRGGLFNDTMDMHGRYAWGFRDADRDVNGLPNGLPTIDASASGLSSIPEFGNELANSVYETNFGPDSQRRGMNLLQADQLFTANELERLLRYFDKDRGAFDRLTELVDFTILNKRRSVTTDSWEVPVIPENLVGQLYTMLTDGSRTPQLVAGPSPFPLTQPLANQVIQDLLSPETLQGLRLDINRPFGDGSDNNSNGFVDEYFQNSANENDIVVYPDGAGGLGSAAMDHLNNGMGFGDPEGFLARYQFAKRLYVLTLLVTQMRDVDGDGRFTVNGDWYDYNGDGNLNAQDAIDFRLDVAQWAVNVVDFRDPDVTNTPFELDIEPFNGWGTNGILNNAILPGGGTENSAEVAVIWGVERPELILTEAIAFHDRMTEDLDTDDGPGEETGTDPSDDDDFDSRLRPTSGVFVELYAPQVSQTPMAELYNGTMAGSEIVLNATSLNNGSPVWRLAFVNAGTATDYAGPSDPNDPRNKNPDDPDSTQRPTGQEMNRFVYFVDPAGTVPLVPGQVAFYPDASRVAVDTLAQGQFLVVGSGGNTTTSDGVRFTSTLGRQATSIEGTAATIGVNSLRSITLIPGSQTVEVNTFDGAGGVTTSTRNNVVSIPIELPRSLSISDPPNGYPAVDSMGNPPVFVGDTFAYSTPFDDPVDKQAFDAGEISQYHFDALRGAAGTTATFNVVHLQRLANPLGDFDPVLNPYITYDTLSVDLTAFNGVTSDEDQNGDDGDDTDFQPQPDTWLASLERGDSEPLTINQLRSRLLWKHETERLPADIASNNQPDDPASPNYFFRRGPLDETFGNLNTMYNNPLFGAAGTVTAYPWLYLADRPFSSGLELASVPVTDNFNLLRKFSVVETTVRNPYQAAGGANSRFGSRDFDPNAGGMDKRFGHLANPFLSTPTAISPPAAQDRTPNFARVFDYIEVPSRFVGTETWLGPDIMQNATSADYNPSLYRDEAFNPGHHRISNFRVPGKVNINTVFSANVWNGLMSQVYAADVCNYNTMDASRQGALAAAPTDFANPFRPAIAANYVPENPLIPDFEVDATLFRRGPSGAPLLDRESLNPFNQSERSAYFRYEARQRLGNLVTTRSSVFAIWITVGYFEVSSVNGQLVTSGDPADPFEAGDIAYELGADDGSLKRERGFYIIDRSIPVAFEPGSNHNVDRMILTESILE